MRLLYVWVKDKKFLSISSTRIQLYCICIWRRTHCVNNIDHCRNISWWHFDWSVKWNVNITCLYVLKVSNLYETNISAFMKVVYILHPKLMFIRIRALFYCTGTFEFKHLLKTFKTLSQTYRIKSLSIGNSRTIHESNLMKVPDSVEDCRLKHYITNQHRVLFFNVF